MITLRGGVGCLLGPQPAECRVTRDGHGAPRGPEPAPCPSPLAVLASVLKLQAGQGSLVPGRAELPLARRQPWRPTPSHDLPLCSASPCSWFPADLAEPLAQGHGSLGPHWVTVGPFIPPRPSSGGSRKGQGRPPGGKVGVEAASKWASGQKRRRGTRSAGTPGSPPRRGRQEAAEHGPRSAEGWGSVQKLLRERDEEEEGPCQSQARGRLEEIAEDVGVSCHGTRATPGQQKTRLPASQRRGRGSSRERGPPGS